MGGRNQQHGCAATRGRPPHHPVPHGEISRPMQGSSCMTCREIWGRRDCWRALVHLLPQERTAPRVRALSSWVWNIPSHGVVTTTARGGERMLYAAALLQGSIPEQDLGLAGAVGCCRAASPRVRSPAEPWAVGAVASAKPQGSFQCSGLEEVRCQLENGLVLPWGCSSGHRCCEAELAG